MNNEKVKEIKKALKETIDGKLSTEYLTVCEISCCPRLDIDRLFADILTLINELEQCSKKWQKLCADEVALNKPLKERIKELETLCNKTYEDLTKEIDRLESENEKLKQHKRELQGGQQDLIKRIAELEKELTNDRVFYKDGICYPMNCQGALKQFAERLKEEAFVTFMGDVIIRGSKVDEVLNEFIKD